MTEEHGPHRGPFATSEEALADLLADATLDIGDEIIVHAAGCSVALDKDCDCWPTRMTVSAA